jgi:hypothetical protein
MLNARPGAAWYREAFAGLQAFGLDPQDTGGPDRIFGDPNST